MLNRVILIGNLTRDAESLLGSRGAVTRMRLATSTQWRDGEGNRRDAIEFHTVVAFSRLAEICAQYCLKGRRIYVEGRMRTRDFEGTDGLRRSSTDVVIDTMRLLDRRDHEDATDLVPAGGSRERIPAGSVDAPVPDDDLSRNSPPPWVLDVEPAAPASAAR